jgi:hypothetical protein
MQTQFTAERSSFISNDIAVFALVNEERNGSRTDTLGSLPVPGCGAGGFDDAPGALSAKLNHRRQT